MISTSRSGSRNGRGLNRTALSTLKMAVFTPMPWRRAASAVAVNPGWSRKARKACLMSWVSASIGPAIIGPAVGTVKHCAAGYTSRMKGPAIFLAQFAGTKPPFDRLESMAQWPQVGYVGVQVPTDPKLFDLEQAGSSKPPAATSARTSCSTRATSCCSSSTTPRSSISITTESKRFTSRTRSSGRMAAARASTAATKVGSTGRAASAHRATARSTSRASFSALI
jgi:hypothetical protein